MVAGIRPDELFNYDAMGELIEECLREEGWCPSEEDPAVWITPKRDTA